MQQRFDNKSSIIDLVSRPDTERLIEQNAGALRLSFAPNKVRPIAKQEYSHIDLAMV